MTHLEQPWFKKCVEASQKGMGHIYAFGIRAIREEKEKFYENGKHKVENYHFRYEPNPFLYQYDLCVHIWLNYYTILEKEIKLLKKNGETEKAKYMEETRILNGIERKEFFFAAAELRWPTYRGPKGEYLGIFIRDPWAEERIEALSDEHYKYVMTFGGGGQGKTVVFCAFMVMMWDHYIFTEKGARAMFSTVGKDKLNSATWPNVQRFIKNTESNISLYAGKGVIAGDHTIKRPGSRDTAGIIKGILISNKKDDSATDKLTGSHGHHFIFYLIDEIQSTPLAPINASSNFTLRCGDYRIAGAGNYNTDQDSLALNVVPIKGWDSVDQNTGRWNSITTNGQNAIVLHFSNERSPGMSAEGARLFPHLPNEKALKEKFKNAASRDIKEKPYRRFWLGWRLEDADGDTVLTSSMVRDNGADMPLQLRQVLHQFLSYDSAQAEGDRNLLGHFREGIDEISEERVWGIHNIIQKVKSSESLDYYTDASKEIFIYARKNKIDSGAMILDWTGRPAHAEILRQWNFMTIQLTYNAAVPDGKRTNPQTKKIDKPILIHEGYDEHGNIVVKNRIWAHMVCQNRISLGAWLLQEYVKSGRVKGINKTMMDWLNSNYTIDEEMFSRKFRTKNHQSYGELQELVPKDDFKEDYGFSPDLLDIWCQAAYYMFTVRKLPISPINGVDQNQPFTMKQTEDMLKEHAELWLEDQTEKEDGHDGIQSGIQREYDEVYWD